MTKTQHKYEETRREDGICHIDCLTLVRRGLLYCHRLQHALDLQHPRNICNVLAIGIMSIGMECQTHTVQMI